MKKSKIIAVDFDGTCVKNRYPYVGEDIGAAPILKKLVEAGHKIILLTMRDCGTVLRDALSWFKKNDIPIYGINMNPSQTWSDSRKVFAHYYIDDQNIGCPVIEEKDNPSLYYVDWEAVDSILKDKNLY